jgi:hypothetical protein
VRPPIDVHGECCVLLPQNVKGRVGARSGRFIGLAVLRARPRPCARAANWTRASRPDAPVRCSAPYAEDRPRARRSCRPVCNRRCCVPTIGRGRRQDSRVAHCRHRSGGGYRSRNGSGVACAACPLRAARVRRGRRRAQADEGVLGAAEDTASTRRAVRSPPRPCIPVPDARGKVVRAMYIAAPGLGRTHGRSLPVPRNRP